MSSKKSPATKARSTKAKPAKQAKPETAKQADPLAAKRGAASKRIAGRFIQLVINNGPTTLDAIAAKCGVDVARVQHHIDNFCNGKKPRVKVSKNGAVELTGEPIAMRKTADAIGEKYAVEFSTPKFAVVKK